MEVSVERERRSIQKQQFSCFTSTKAAVYLLQRYKSTNTDAKPQPHTHAHADGSGFGAERRSTLKQQVLTLLALLVQKYLLYFYKVVDGSGCGAERIFSGLLSSFFSPY
jgi:hypothetical protein